MTAFASGDYQTAAKNLESLISQVAQDTAPQLEPIYFTLGAAYYNLGDYPKAIETLKKFLQKFPKSAKVNEAAFSLAQATVLSKDYEGAAAIFKQLETDPVYREQALLFEGMAYKEAKKTDEAIGALERLVSAGIRNTNSANGAILLASLYSEKGQSAKSLAVIQAIRQNIALLDNVARLNALAVELGDSLLQNNQPKEALTCYRVVRSRDEVIKFQTDRVAAIQRRIDQNKAAIRPENVVAIATQNKQLAATLEENKKLVEDFQKLPDFGPALLLRMADCLYKMDKKWEAIVVYDELLRRYPEDTNRETAR